MTIAFAVVVAARGASAAPVCNPDEAAADAAALREHLTDEAARAARWNFAWGVGFGAATLGQLGLAAAQWNPLGAYDRNYEDTLYVGAGKAAIGALARVVLPLHIRVPALVEDPCADRAALRAALADAGQLERALFWTSHIGGFVVNLGGAAILGERTSWSVAAIAFAIGYPVGLFSTYTMPRGSWHAWSTLEASTLVVVPVPNGAAVMLGGTF